MSKPLVSIIIPVFNTERYLAKCIESVLEQTYKEYEIFLIDDGSTDASGELCDSFAEKYPFIHTVHKENEGQGVARNVALDLCRGEYIAFIDSDDSVRPDYIEKMVFACEENMAQLCVCGYISDSGLRKVSFSPRPRTLNSKELMEAYLTTPDIGGAPWNKIYKKSLFEELRFPGLRANEDAYLMADIIRKTSKAIVIADALYVQYIRAGSTERSGFSEKRLCLLTADLHLMDIIDEFYPELKQNGQFKYAKSLKALMQGIVDSGEKQHSELFKELHKKFMLTKQNLDKEQIKRLGVVLDSANSTALLFKGYTLKKNIRGTLKKLLMKVKA